ncbi:MAG: DUF481 domain-containing protein [Gemmatimonadota bacterium]|nr:DUF481 domain-containing protein [Gemmatimonadota bacterium]
MLTRLAIALALGAAAPIGVTAQSTAQPTTPPVPSTWAFATSLGFQQSTGSTTLVGLTGEQQIADTTGTQQLGFSITGAYSYTRYTSIDTTAAGTLVPAKRRVNTRRVLADFTERYFVGKAPYIAGHAQWERDDNQGIDRRIFLAAGAGMRWINDKQQQLLTEITAGHLYERDQASSATTNPALSFVVMDNITYGKDNGTIQLRLERLQNLRDGGDALHRGHAGITVPFNTKLALSVSYDATHDTRPALGIFDTDASDDVVTQPTRYNGNLSVGLTVSW